MYFILSLPFTFIVYVVPSIYVSQRTSAERNVIIGDITTTVHLFCVHNAKDKLFQTRQGFPYWFQDLYFYGLSP